ncbi:AraC family transcriptional regulator ligand-binding domain-containing protein [Undibacterium sp. CY18W]|uniref:AraC family transcriptional regulator ligand-binding domain-containing protein n=1 Tax=Undibacterium hunanense TaxID=2762292 RepID=A0ABR6ZMF5_9BURK|nr:AraC family transcriptional regulator [Undibacterium hunanense]MBC3916733.1 AraC family transcriptional regulator ligand-binding domain-containing protein [Undibacterium hunanense]
MKRATHFSVQPGWRLLLSDMGLNPDHLLRLANLPADLFSRKEASITAAQYFGLWQAIETSAGIASLPLKVGAAISVEAFDPPIFASLCSANLNIAMQRLSAFKKLIGPMTLSVHAGLLKTSITLECYGSEGSIPRSLAMTELVFLTQLVRLGTRHRVIPLEVTVPEIPANAGEYVDYFGLSPKKGAAIRIVFSSQDGVRPFLTANEAMWAYFEPGLRKRLSSLDSTAKMSDRVRAVLLEGLPAGEYSIESVARHLAVSKRTLQRQLNEESTSFMDILNTTRQQLAQHYLSSPSVSQGEIAYLLGFQEVNSFIRAFKDWTGNTPSAYRHETVKARH